MIRFNSLFCNFVARVEELCDFFVIPLQAWP